MKSSFDPDPSSAPTAPKAASAGVPKKPVTAPIFTISINLPEKLQLLTRISHRFEEVRK